MIGDVRCTKVYMRFGGVMLSLKSGARGGGGRLVESCQFSRKSTGSRDRGVAYLNVRSRLTTLRNRRPQVLHNLLEIPNIIWPKNRKHQKREQREQREQRETVSEWLDCFRCSPPRELTISPSLCLSLSLSLSLSHEPLGKS